MAQEKLRLKVLVFPASTENGLEIWKSLKYLKEIELHAATSKGVNHTEYVYNDINYVKSVYEDGWVEDLNEVIKKYEIDCIYPANSIVIDKLIEFRDEITCKVVLPESSVVKLTRSKKRTLDLLSGMIPVPKIYEQPNDISEYPVFCKPDSGYGSQNVALLKSQLELRSFFADKDIEDYVIQEYLPGKEYSVDCFSNGEKLLFFAGRSRQRIRMGTSMHSEIVSQKLEKEIGLIANKIQREIKISGAWFFQLKEDENGILKLLEIDIRIAGTMALNRVRGLNFPLLSLYLFNDRSIDLLINKYEVIIDRCLKNRYKTNIVFDKVFIDLDETIILNKNYINLDIVRFLFQCINKKIKIVLLSKNLEKDKVSYLKRFRILDIFDEIIWIAEHELKSEYIYKHGHNNSIFIDDSFTQRKEVFDRLNIPTFDLSMIEILLDDRYENKKLSLEE